MEASVNIVAVSPHRREALEAVAWAIDELKMRIPIWKKEYYDQEDDEDHGKLMPQWKKNPEYN
jgi:molybdopterin synthase catalytic subunit